MPFRDAPHPPPGITPLQRRLACLIAQGFGQKRIARELNVCESTVAKQWAALRLVLRIQSPGPLADLCVRWGWMQKADLFSGVPRPPSSDEIPAVRP